MTLGRHCLAAMVIVATVQAQAAPLQATEQSHESQLPSEFVDPQTGVRLVFDRVCASNFDYPGAAERAQAEGTTRLRLSISPKGHIDSIEVVGSSGPSREHRLLDNAAKSAFSACRVILPNPGNWQPQASTINAVYQWRLP